MLKRQIILSCISFIVVFALMVPVIAADWPNWRGPNRNGISEETNWSPKALSGSPNILWETNLGRGHSAFSIKGNLVYTMGQKEVKTATDSLFTDIIYCINAKTGKKVWRYAYSSTRRRWPGPGATPVIDGSVVYVLSRDGALFCFNATNGRVIWKRDLIKDNLTQMPGPGWGFCGSPVIENKLLIMNAGKSGLALNKKTGKVVWKSEPESGGTATPVIFNSGDKRIAAIASSNTLYAVDVKTGEVQWDHRWSADADPSIINNQILLIGGHRGRGSKLLAIKKGKPKIVWETRNARHSFPTPVILNGYAYGFGWVNRKQPLQCIDVKTGEVKWSKTISKLGDYGSLIAANGKLIILNSDGELIIAEASPKAYKVISSAKLFRLKTFGSYPEGDPNCCWTAPILSNGKIYARTTYGALVCVDMKTQSSASTD